MWHRVADDIAVRCGAFAFLVAEGHCGTARCSPRYIDCVK